MVNPRRFPAFRVPAFRLYFGGQVVTQAGTWFQNLTISLVVLDLAGAAGALAIVAVAQFAPAALLAPAAGGAADRWRPRTILLICGLSTMAVATALAIAVAVSRDGELSLGYIYALVLVNGCIAAFERVAAQAFIVELVGEDRLQSGVVLTSVGASVARAMGPALAGAVYAVAGPTVCLVVNAASCAIVVATLLAIRPRSLDERPKTSGGADSGALIVALRYLAKDRPLLTLLMVNVAITIGAMNLNIVITAVVTLQFEGDAGALGAAHALNAVGAVLGGLALTRAARVRVRSLSWACAAYGAALLLNALAPDLGWFLLLAPVLGIGLGIYHAVLYSAAQLASPRPMIGRVMALMNVGQFGVAPLGALYAGALIDTTTAQVALAVGAVVCVACAVWVALVLRRG